MFVVTWYISEANEVEGSGTICTTNHSCASDKSYSSAITVWQCLRYCFEYLPWVGCGFAQKWFVERQLFLLVFLYKSLEWHIWMSTYTVYSYFLMPGRSFAKRTTNDYRTCHPCTSHFRYTRYCLTVTNTHSHSQLNIPPHPLSPASSADTHTDPDTHNFWPTIQRIGLILLYG